jgi:hypothetical protein
MLRSKVVRISQDGTGLDDLLPDEVYFEILSSQPGPPLWS